MKRLLLTTVFTIITAGSFAQNWNSDNDNHITFGLAGGENLAYLQVASAHRQDVWTDSESPFSLGLNADFKFNDYFSIRPGIFYSGMGGTINATYGDPDGTNVNAVNTNDEYILHYLEVPVDFIGHLPVGDGANIFLGGGPFYAYGLSGTNKQSFFTDDPVVEKIKFGSNGDFKSTDFGITSVLGFQGAKGWSIDANLEFGLTNIIQNNTTGFDATKLNTITFYLSIGQSF